MSSKSPRIAEIIRDCSHPVFPPHYIGYFTCFNAGRYYEAHDVLEALWLKGGKTARNYAFYKGLIQIAGSFVHMKLHHQAPSHHVHGKRLHPASRLLHLAINNTANYDSPHLGLNLQTLHQLCRHYLDALKNGRYAVNPWTPNHLPTLKPET